MRLRAHLTTVVAAVALLATAPSSTASPFHRHICSTGQSPKVELACAQRNIYHARFTLGWIKNERRRTLQVLPVSAPKLFRLHQMERNMSWLLQLSRSQHRAANIQLHPPSVRQWVWRYHPCLAGIISGENAAYDPTLDYGGGHGNVGEAYGVPQANPGTKMASAGADWRTNPWTQVRWMIVYVINRYGGECQALAVKQATGSY